MKFINIKPIFISLSVALLLTLSFCADYTIARENGDDQRISKLSGLDLLPPELRNRWNSLVDEADSSLAKEYVEEGKLVIRQLETLIEVVGGTPPRPGDASYAVYMGVLNQLIELLDTIELATVLNLADDEYLEQLLDEYRTEKTKLADEIRTDRQTLIDAGGQRIREQLKDPAYRKDPLRREIIADLYFRLAELNFQETEDKFGEQLEHYTDELNRLMETDPSKISSLKEPVKDNRRVLSLYQKIVDEFADTQYGVDALYNIAVLTAESDDPDDKATANQYFETLIELYPGNKYTLNSLRRIGDYYFNPPVNDIEQSIRIYGRIAREFKDDIRYTEALYMLGWCHYRLSELPTSVEYFAKVLDNGYDEDGNKINRREIQDFASDAMKYVGICYSVDTLEWDESGVDGLVAWLQKHPTRLNNYGPDAVKQIGEIYAIERGQYPEGVYAYEKFIELFPLEPRAPEIQLAILDVFLEGLIYDIDRAHAEMVKFYDVYNPDSEWWAANEDIALRRQTIPKLEGHLNTIVDDKLAMAWDNNDSLQYVNYENYSRQYLRFWPAGPNAYKIHANLAGVLKQKLNRPMDAMREYWQVATIYEDTSKLEQACSEVALIAIDFANRELKGEIYVSPDGEILPPDMKPLPELVEEPEESISEETAEADSAKAADPRVVNRTPLYHSEELELSSFDLYLTSFPTGKLSALILYTAGNLLYEHDWIPESRPYFERLIVEHPEGKFLESAYTQILEGYFKSKDLEGVEWLASRIDTAQVSDELKSAAYERKAYSILSNAKNLKESGDHIAAAEEFLRVALQTGKYEQADAALFQAGLEFAMGKEFSRANEAYLMLVDRYPGSDRADKALYNVALHLQNDLDSLASAAAMFERLADDYPQTEQLQAALAGASLNFDKVEDHASVIRINERYIRLFPDADDADIYLFEMADHFLKLDDIVSANEIYSRFASKYPDDPRTVQAYFERGAYFHRQNDTRSATTEFRATIDAHDRQLNQGASGSPKHASLALNLLIFWEHEEYSNLNYTGSPSNVATAKERKTQWRDELIEKYKKLTQLGMKEGYKAYYEIGRLFDEQALATYNQDLPYIEKLEDRWEALDLVVDEAIALNITTTGQFQEGYKQLNIIAANLDSFRTINRSDYEKFSELVSQMQTDTLAVGLPDSVSKLERMGEALAELDSAYDYSVKWAEECKVRVPEVAVRNGDYLMRSWLDRFEYRSTDRVPELRMLFREEVLKGVLTPMAPEVLGFYLQALQVTKETGVDVERWTQYLDERFSMAVDTLFDQWDEQLELTRSTIDGYNEEYASMLPRGEWAESREGFYLDMMGEMILSWIEHQKTFNQDILTSFTVLLDTIQTYEYPIDFAAEALDRPLEHILSEYDIYMSYADIALNYKEEYALRYEEEPYWYDPEMEEEVEAYWWDDAAYAYEDVSASFSDYGIVLLEEGLNVREQYALSGLAGIAILRKLVELRPDEYASMVGIEPKKYSLASDTEWKIWPIYETGFEELTFDDSEWIPISIAGFPSDVDFGIIDSLDALSIWHSQEEPEGLPEWFSVPESITASEGELIEFTLIGAIKQRGVIPEDEYYEDEYYEDEYEEDVEDTPVEEDLVEEEVPEVEEEERPEIPLGADLSIQYNSSDIPFEAEFADSGNGIGTFRWQPSFIDAGEYTAEFTLYNHDIPAMVEVPITVENVDRGFDWVDVPNNYSIEEGLSVDFDVVGVDPDGDALTVEYSTENIPDAAIFTDNGDGSANLYWETTFEDSGMYTATFGLSDGDTVLLIDVPILVENAIRAPRWVDVPLDVTGEQNELLEFTVVGQHPDELPLTIEYSSEYLPMEATFADNGDGTGSLTWQPTFEDEGSYDALFTLTDGEMIADTIVTIFIGAVARPPQWVTVPIDVTGGEGEMIEIEVVGEHPTGEPLMVEFSSGDIPETAIFTDYGDGTGVLVWETAFGDEGSYSAVFTLSDGLMTVDTTVAVFVGAVARPPVWIDVPLDISGGEGELIEFTVTGEHPDGLPVTIEYESLDLPETALFTDNGDGTGSFSWQTAEGDEGTFNVNLTLNDGTLFADVTIPVYIGAVAKPPVWIDAPAEASGEEGELIEFFVAGEHPDGIALIIDFTSDDLPVEAVFIDNADGTGNFSWQTIDGDEGSYTAVLTLTDGTLSAETSVSIFVGGVAKPPVWIDVPSEVTGDEGDLIEFTVAGEHPDALSVTIDLTADNLPGEAAFIDNGDGTALFSWEPVSGDAGDYNLLFSISDGELSADAAVLLTVAATAANPPVWLDYPSEVSATEGDILEFILTGEHPDGLPLAITFESDNLPLSAFFEDQGDGTGSFGWETALGDAGDYSALFTLSDGELFVEADILISVAAGESPPPEWIDVPSEITGETGTLIEFSVFGQSSVGLPLSIEYASDDLPEDALFSDFGDGSGSFSWEPGIEYAGIFTAYFTLSDGNESIDAEVSIIVTAIAGEPAWIDIPAEVVGETGSLIEFTVVGEDPSGSPLTIYLTSEDLPAEAQFIDNGDGSGVFSWQPTVDDAGLFTAALSLSNGSTEIFANVEIIVIAAEE